MTKNVKEDLSQLEAPLVKPPPFSVSTVEGRGVWGRAALVKRWPTFPGRVTWGQAPPSSRPCLLIIMAE